MLFFLIIKQLHYSVNKFFVFSPLEVCFNRSSEREVPYRAVFCPPNVFHEASTGEVDTKLFRAGSSINCCRPPISDHVSTSCRFLIEIKFLSEIPAILWIEIANKDGKTRIQTLNLKHDQITMRLALQTAGVLTFKNKKSVSSYFLLAYHLLV